MEREREVVYGSVNLGVLLLISGDNYMLTATDRNGDGGDETIMKPQKQSQTR